MWHRFRLKIQKTFIAGILVVLPLTITYLLLKFLFQKVDAIFQPMLINLLDHLPFAGKHITYIPGLGISATIILILAVGIVAKNVVGKELVILMDAILGRIPLVRSIYISSKQFLETISLANSGQGEYNKVVLVEYPRKGLYSLGFVTCDSTGEPQLVTKENVVNVFIPTTPNPTSGMLIMVPRGDLIPLSMTVEDGLKLVVSAGIVTPPLNNSKEIPAKTKKSWFRKSKDESGNNET